MPELNNKYITKSGSSYDLNSNGKIEGICGPMKSGKSDELIRILNRSTHGGLNVLALKPSKDTRDKNLESRSGTSFESKIIDNINSHSLIEYILKRNYDVIGIDEGQFVDGIADFCILMSRLGKTVYVSFLNGSYQQKPFKNMTPLYSYFDTIIQLSALCSECPYGNGRDAPFTILLDSTEIDAELNMSGEDKNILVGDEIYKPVCRKCLSDANNV